MYDIRTVRHNVCIWRFVFLNVPNHVRGNLVQPCAQIGRHKPYADLVRAPCLVQGLVDLVRALCLTTLCVPCACLCVTLCATLPPAQGVRTLCANQLSAQAMLTLCATQRRAQGPAQGAQFLQTAMYIDICFVLFWELCMYSQTITIQTRKVVNRHPEVLYICLLACPFVLCKEDITKQYV